MKKHLILAGAVAITCCMTHAARAQSPWETDAFKSYDQVPSNQAGSSSGTALGLQGYSLSPNAADGTQQVVPQAPAAQPALQSAPQAAPITATASVRSAPVSVTPPNMNAREKQLMASLVDTSFVSMSTRSMTALVSTAQLAQKNASTSEMQRFAEQISSIYGPMIKEVAELGKKNNILTRPITAPQSDLDRLAKVKGADFDKEFIRIQAQNFSMLNSVFSREADKGQVSALKSYASDRLSMLKQQKDVVSKSYVATRTPAIKPPASNGSFPPNSQ